MSKYRPDVSMLRPGAVVVCYYEHSSRWRSPMVFLVVSVNECARLLVLASDFDGELAPGQVMTRTNSWVLGAGKIL